MSPAISMKGPSRQGFFYVSPCVFLEDTVVAPIAIQETADDPKAFFREGLQLSAKGSVQQNWGRIQAEDLEQSSRRLTPSIAGMHSKSGFSRGPRLLEVFQRGSLPASLPPADREHVIQEVLGGMMEATESSLLVQLAYELRKAGSLPEKWACLKSWLDRVEGSVRESRQCPGDTTPKTVVLERLEGYVDRIEGATAYVTLRSQYGDELTGEYASDELATKGITEGRRFLCETVEVNGAVQVFLEAVPEESLSEDEEDAIRHRIAELVQGNEIDGHD